MQNKKEQPKVVVLRPALVIVAVLVFIFIGIVILINLVGSVQGFHQTNATENKVAETLATTENTGWYQKEQIQRPKLAVKKAASHRDQNKPSKAPEAAIGQGQIRRDQTKKILDAMKAPISNNQITGNVYPLPDHDVHSTTPMPLLPNGLESEDQNQQMEKQNFMQTHALSPADDYLHSMLNSPRSPYEVQAGTQIPGILVTGINSDLPGQITAMVRANVYDSVTGNYLLIPQGSRLIGVYDSQVSYGQRRVLVAWQRILFPNGSSFNLQGMPGVDLSGYAGFSDQVNNHYCKIFGSVLLMSVMSAGAQLSQPRNNSNNPFATPSIGQIIAANVGTNIANTSNQLTIKNLNIQPTLQIRPGYRFNISVTKDMVFAHPYPMRFFDE